MTSRQTIRVMLFDDTCILQTIEFVYQSLLLKLKSKLVLKSSSKSVSFLVARTTAFIQIFKNVI